MKLLSHVISASQFRDKNELEAIFKAAADMERLDKEGALPQPLMGKVVAAVFYEPSTRTRFSFETAVQKLGGGVITAENAATHSSAAKGETLEDAIRVIGGYADAIVLRHFEKGAAERAVKVSPVPVINAGDGAGEHPTQALLDLYTIKKELGSIEGKTIVLVGDLLYGRTVHSLLPLLALYKGIKIHLVAPKSLQLPAAYVSALKKKKIPVRTFDSLAAAVSSADVLYVTRVQKERFNDIREYEKVKGAYIVSSATLKKMKKGAIIMHPLPRVGEITTEVDADPRAAYFREARNGLYVRMALLAKIFLHR